MATDYMPIAERVRVVEMIDTVFETQVFDGQSGVIDTGWAGTFVGRDEQRAKICEMAIVAAIQLACEAVRERCAEEVRRRCFACEGTGRCANEDGSGYQPGSTCKFCGAFVAAIRELEL